MGKYLSHSISSSFVEIAIKLQSIVDYSERMNYRIISHSVTPSPLTKDNYLITVLCIKED